MPNAQQFEVSNLARPSTSSVPSRLEFIDGLRAICAIYVVMFHCVMAIENFNAMPRWVRWIGRPFGFWGHQSVDVFIVLSGFCLMLPVARSGELKLRNGFIGYLSKQAWRILPPYYAVLLICLVMTALLPGLRHPGPSWSHALPAFEPGVIVSHLLLIHNWSLDWFQKINPSL